VLDGELKRRIQNLCPGVAPELIDDFFVRMDDDYFTTFSPEEIASHIHMSTRLDSKHRVQVCVTPSSNTDEFEIVIVGFDYLSEFSIFCGLLSAFGLDIQAGHVYSFAKSTVSRSPRKIVDVFNVAVKAGEVFDGTKQREFEAELQRLAHLLAAGSIDEARERLNRFLTERVETMDESLSGLGHPIEIRFDNDLSPEWTVMEARSQDAFALLYGISNALGMQGIYIHKVEIRRAGEVALDQFFIADASGRKILSGTQQERLRTAVAMIKQFTRFLPEAPDPAKAMHHFDQFLDKMAEEQFPDHIITFLARSEGMNLLAHVLGSSDYLWDDFLGIHFRNLVPFLERLARQTALPVASSKDALRRDLRDRLRAAATFDDKKTALNRFKDDQLFITDAQHLLDPRATLINFSEALTDLAEVVIDEAVNMCFENIDRPTRGAFTVCGLGKFGGREMGYASDLELLFIHEETEGVSGSIFESLARRVVECIEARDKGVFQIDLRLRPYGDAGSWSVPFDEFKRYYSLGGQALPFERQALVKLRWVAGNEWLGRRVEAHRDKFTYSDAPWDRENALHLRRRQIRELVKPGEINVKYSAGGIIDIEYAIQYLQLLHGKHYPELRSPNTLHALDVLHRLEIIQAKEYEVLHPAYLFLRNLIDALRIVRGDASDLLLPEETSEEFKALARRLGYRENDRTQAALKLAADIRQRMKNVHAVFLAHTIA
jgi:[glutamine synthetase] adenylyltransferase / [glutamine synthetase]-adenylyl-L-tyrosine phosphorylase